MTPLLLMIATAAAEPCPDGQRPWTFDGTERCATLQEIVDHVAETEGTVGLIRLREEHGITNTRPSLRPDQIPGPQGPYAGPGSHGLEPVTNGPLTEGGARVGGGLTPEQARVGMASERDQLIACYEAAATRHDGLRANVQLVFTVAEDGRTERVELKRLRVFAGDARIEDLDFARCLLFATADTGFPSLSSGTRAQLSYPLTFKPR